MNYHRSIYSDGVDRALRTINGADAGLESVVFSQCCRDGIAVALRGGCGVFPGLRLSAIRVNGAIDVGLVSMEQMTQRRVFDDCGIALRML